MITIFGEELNLDPNTQITYFKKGFKYPTNKNIELTNFLDLPKCTLRALNILKNYIFVYDMKKSERLKIQNDFGSLDLTSLVNIQDVETIIEFGEWVQFFMMRKVHFITPITIEEFISIHPNFYSDIILFATQKSDSEYKKLIWRFETNIPKQKIYGFPNLISIIDNFNNAKIYWTPKLLKNLSEVIGNKNILKNINLEELSQNSFTRLNLDILGDNETALVSDHFYYDASSKLEDIFEELKCQYDFGKISFEEAKTTYLFEISKIKKNLIKVYKDNINIICDFDSSIFRTEGFDDYEIISDRKN